MQCLYEQELLDKAFNATPCLIAISTISTGRFIKVNQCFEEFTGYTRAEALGRTSIELKIFDEPTRARLLQMFTDQGVLRNVISRYHTKDGTARIGLFSAEKIHYNGANYLLTFANDITEQKNLEEEIARLERMSAIVQMAATVAHEVRNPLTCVRGFLQLFSNKEDLSPYHELMKIMIDELDRANAIMTQYLLLARARGTRSSTLRMENLNTILQEIEPLIVVNGYHSKGAINYDLNPLPDIPLNKEEIRQLILNLTRNALESMPNGGDVTIKTYIDEEHIILSVEDQGTGMDASVLEKLGTPFFTTKDKGTGLGLAVCYGIAEDHSAEIRINSSPRGTEVLVIFKKLNLEGNEAVT